MLNRRGGIECDLTVTRLGGERFLIVTGTAFGRHDRSWIEQHAPATDRSRSATSPARWRASACGVRAPATPRRVCDDDLTFPYMQARHGHRRRRAVLGAAGHVRRRARLGAVPERRVRPARCGTRCSRPGGRTASCPAGYRAIDSLRLEKGYRVWGIRHHVGDRPVLGGARVRRALRRDASSAADALPAADGGPQRLVCLVLDDLRSVALGNEPVRTPAARSSGG